MRSKTDKSRQNFLRWLSNYKNSGISIWFGNDPQTHAPISFENEKDWEMYSDRLQVIGFTLEHFERLPFKFATQLNAEGSLIVFQMPPENLQKDAINLPNEVAEVFERVLKPGEFIMVNLNFNERASR